MLYGKELIRENEEEPETKSEVDEKSEEWYKRRGEEMGAAYLWDNILCEDRQDCTMSYVAEVAEREMEDGKVRDMPVFIRKDIVEFSKEYDLCNDDGGKEDFIIDKLHSKYESDNLQVNFEDIYRIISNCE